MKITKLNPGDVFVSSNVHHKSKFFLQITEDGDCGVFLGCFLPKKFDKMPLSFRIIPAEMSIKKEMNKVGNFSIHPILRREYFYFRKDIDGQAYQKFSIVDSTAREMISKELAETLELLAFWESNHIDERLRGRKFFATV